MRSPEGSGAPSSLLRGCEAGVWANIRRFESEHNAVSGYAGPDQLFRNSFLGAIVLYPHLAIPNIKMQNAPVNAIDAIPTRIHQLIVVLGFVEDHFDLNITTSGSVLGIALNQLPNYLSILI
jgi:hypothetical protein